MLRVLRGTAFLLLSALFLNVPAIWSADFKEGNIVVYRVGNGSGSLVNTGSPVFLDEYKPDGTLVQSIPLPTTVNGANKQLIASGTATSEGLLARSADGRYLILTGYARNLGGSGSLASTASATVNRTVGRVDASGNIDTSTALGDFADGNNPRSATSSDGTNIWVGGAAGGVRFTTLGSTTSTQLSTTVSNIRQVEIFNNQLYVSTNSGTTIRIGAVGSGVPTIAGQTITNLPGFPLAAPNGGNPDAYFFANLSGGAGMDTLYVADDAVGLSKFSLVNGNWVFNGTVGVGSQAYRGLTANVSGATVTLFATRNGGGGATGGGELVTLTDGSGFNGAFSGTPTVIATAAANTAFRGVAQAPVASAKPDLKIAVSGPSTAIGGVNFSYTLTASNFGPADATGVGVQFTLPAGLNFISASGSGFGASQANGVVTFTNGTINAFSSATLTVIVNTNAAGTYTVPTGAAIVDPGSTVAESDEANNTSLATVNTVVSVYPDLSVTVGAPATGAINVPFAYTLTASNTGAADASGVAVQFTVPAGLSVNNMSGVGFTAAQAANVVTFSGGSIPKQGSVALTVSVSATVAGTYTAPAAAAVIDPSNAIQESNESNNASPNPTSTLVTTTPPIAADDAYRTTASTPLNVDAAHGIFSNDNGSGHPLQVIVNSAPSHGTLSLNGATGSFVYTPDNGFTGNDTFSYKISNAVQLWKSTLPQLGVVGAVTIKGGGYGSSLYADPNSPGHDEYFGLQDRGPNVGGPGGIKIEPIPSFVPSIGKFKLLPDGTALLEASISLKDGNGNPYSGRVNTLASTGEIIQDLNGNIFPPDPNGYDPEGLVALPDGSFWVSDEYGPFVTHFDSGGNQIGRLSPFDKSLPAELAARVPNKGMEGLTITPDGSTLVGIMQAALQQSDLPSNGGTPADPTTITLLRIVTYRLSDGALHEYTYLMEGKFGASEITALSNTTFLVDERDGKFVPSSTKSIFKIDISGATDIGPNSPLIGTGNFTYSANTATGGGLLVNGKSLELLCYNTATNAGLSKSAAVAALSNAGITPVAKSPYLDLAGLLVSLDSNGRFFPHDKVEGVAVLNNGHQLMISNDSDFGISDSPSTQPPYALSVKVCPATGQQDDSEFLLVNLDQLPTATATATVTISVIPPVTVAAGDVTANDVILWTHAVDPNAPASMNFTAQVANDINFANVVATANGDTDPAQDYTLKLNVAGLQPGTTYYYRFVGPLGITSNTGRFKTAYAPDAKVAVRFAFSGDCDGKWRPFPSVADIGSQNLDFFEFCGDTMYENAVSPATSIAPASGAVTAPESNVVQCLKDLRRKYLENTRAVNLNGNQSLTNFFAAQANYTLLDNHELCSNIGKGAYQCGGAPDPGPGAVNYNPANASNDINLNGPFTNKTPEFMACQQAFRNYEPIREHIINAPGDPRTDGTQQMFVAQQWGKNLLFVNTDDRSYADIRMSVTTSPRADNPLRTRLGKTQLAWLEQLLLDAKAAGTTWKVVTVSDPIDQLGPIGASLTGSFNGLPTSDSSKSWMGGYRAERNALLKFIADNKIKNVVFLATDDHLNRVNELLYVPDPVNAPTVRAYVPSCFTVVCGPIGASGPDAFTDHTFASLQTICTNYANAQKAQNLNPIGLDPAFPGLHDVVREGDPNADANRAPIDFFSPDTFNFATLDVSADGKTLKITTIGINSHAANSFQEPSVTGPVRQILSFQVDADAVPITCSADPASGEAGVPIPLKISVALTNPQFPQTVSVQISGVPATATLSAGINNGGGTWTLTSAQLAGLTVLSPVIGTFPLAITATDFDSSNLAIGSAKAVLNLTVNDTTAPIFTNVPDPVVTEQTNGAGTPVVLPLPQAWDLVDPNPVVTSDAPAVFPLGKTVVTFTATDASGNKATATTLVTVVDTTAPVLANVPAPFSVEQSNLNGTPVALPMPTATDICDAAPAVISNAPAVFPLGKTTVTFTATDASGNKTSATTDVTVVDTTSPVITNVSATPNEIWPPNKKMVPVQIAVTASDICDAAPVSKIISVTSNEPGAGQFQITGNLTLTLLADRAGNGTGRIYTITVRCTDASGNSSTGSVDVKVPHDQGK